MKSVLHFVMGMSIVLTASATYASGTDGVNPFLGMGGEGRVKLDVGAYVPGALLHFDGIRNAGADLPHDPAATTWKNLGTAGVDASFQAIRGDASGWGTRGYQFQGKSMAQTLQPVNLGQNFTIQEVLDVDCANQIKPDPHTWPNYFAEMRDNCVFTRDLGNTLELKSDSFGSKTRTYCKNWAGRYFTCIVGPSDIYLTQSTSYENRIARTESADTGAQTWTWGSSAMGTAQRYVIGTFYSVRVYPRVLTEEELAWNRLVDEFRFRDVLPADYSVVDVRSDELGAFDAASSGAFLISGAQTFTVDAEVTAADGNVYTNAGYTVETWNAEKKTWGAPVVSAGTSYAAAGTAGSRVRLTWLWGLKRGVRVFDADAYAPNDLLLNFDGFFNVGRGQAHDSSATTWKNLGEVPTVATFNPESDDTSFWRATGFYFAGRNYAQIAGAADPGLQFTIQEAMTLNTLNQPTLPDQTTYPSYFGAPNDMCNLYSFVVFKTDLATGSSWEGGRPKFSGTWSGLYLTAGVDYDKSMLTQGTSPGSWAGVKFGSAIGPQRWTWGSSLGGGGGKTQRYMRGTIHSVRLYARNLTVRDLVRNREVDEVRFRGVVPDGAVQVRSTVQGIEADDFCGVYQMVGGASKTFTQPARVTGPDGRIWAVDGCRIETWNAAKALWVESGTAAAYTFTEGAGVAKARLTWQWRPAKGLRAAYDVGDYVQDGLVGHWDGIRNKGPAVPHDAASATWVDLSGFGRDATYFKMDPSISSTYDLTDRGAWVADGYDFTGVSWWAIGNTLDLGRRFTVQLVCDVDFSKQTANRSGTGGAPWPTFFGQTGDCGNLYTYGKGNALNFKCDGITGNKRAQLAGFQGRYVNAMFDDGNSAVFQTSVRPAYVVGNPPSPASAIGAKQWSWGSTAHGVQNTGSLDRCLVGTIHAVRLYDRILTDAELARNRAVDENRFRGAGIATTNVLVASRAKLAQGVEANGAYEVDGEWMFTAVPVTATRADGREVVLTPTGYTLETWGDGAWGVPTAYSSTNYAHSVATQPTPVRLTWIWSRNDGTMLIVR